MILAYQGLVPNGYHGIVQSQRIKYLQYFAVRHS
jgi:hypothetical protein